jgi:hypothetical protein
VGIEEGEELGEEGFEGEVGVLGCEVPLGWREVDDDGEVGWFVHDSQRRRERVLVVEYVVDEGSNPNPLP